MLGKLPSKDEAFGALDLIVNVLKDHEKDLDKLLNELGNVAQKFDDAGELNSKVEKVGEKISGLQNDVADLVKRLSTSTPLSQIEKPVVAKVEVVENEPALAPAPAPSAVGSWKGLSVVLQVRRWEDFQVLAAQAQIVSFNFKETERNFKAGAIKNNHLITYSGELPNLAALFKNWLSRGLSVSEANVLEGTLALG